LKEEVESEHEYKRLMAAQMLSKFEKYWSEFSVVLALAIALDPRYKLELVNFCYSRLYGVNNSREYCHVRDKFVYLFIEYGGSLSSSSSAISLDARHVNSQVPQPQVKAVKAVKWTSATMKVKLYVYFVIYVLLFVT
jgi:hypothetical protein